MEFDWIVFDSKEITREEIMESFEDPFCLKLFPDAMRFSAQSRFFSYGKSLNGKAVFSVYSSTGKTFKILATRLMSAEELYFYERKERESL